MIDTGVDADGDKHYKLKSTVDIQILVNTRALKVGDELVHYQAAPKESKGNKRPFDVIWVAHVFASNIDVVYRNQMHSIICICTRSSVHMFDCAAIVVACFI